MQSRDKWIRNKNWEIARDGIETMEETIRQGEEYSLNITDFYNQAKIQTSRIESRAKFIKRRC